MPVNGVAIGSIGIGGILLWSGLNNKAAIVTARDLISGHKPAPGPMTTPAVTQSLTSTPAGTTTSSIANDAMRYEGHPYLYGGAPGPTGAKPWDCSSFVNWVLGHDMGFTLPGMRTPGYNGESHGPITTEYLVWSGAETVSHNGNDAMPGDLAVWQTHMGIVIGENQMISAQDPALGTGVSEINGAIPEFLFIRRIVIGNPEG